MLFFPKKQFNIPEAKHSFCGRRYIMLDIYKIEYGWHLFDFAYSFVLKRKGGFGWRRIISTHPEFHDDFQGVKEYLLWYKDFLV